MCTIVISYPTSGNKQINKSIVQIRHLLYLSVSKDIKYQV